MTVPVMSNDHATLMFNVILTFYFFVSKTRSFSGKLHIIKTVLVILNKLTILFIFKIGQYSISE